MSQTSIGELSEVPHGSEAVNDKHRQGTKKSIKEGPNGELTLKAPKGMGSYDVRMHDNDKNGKEISSVKILVVDRDIPTFQWEIMNDREFSGKEWFESEVGYLVKSYIDSDDLGYGIQFAGTLRLLGWIKPVQRQEEEIKKRITERLFRMGMDRLNIFLDYAGFQPEDRFYDCLCKGYRNPNMMIKYHPDPYPGSPNCNNPAKGPCVFVGCGRRDLPKDKRIWERCLRDKDFYRQLVKMMAQRRIEIRK